MDDIFDVTGRLALVTGSSRGLGRSLALGLAQAGARVVLHGRDRTALAQAREQIAGATGTDPIVTSFDVTDPDEVEPAIAELVRAHGVPDILVNNAGLQRRASFIEFDVADWDVVIASNLSSAFYVAPTLSSLSLLT